MARTFNRTFKRSNAQFHSNKMDAKIYREIHDFSYK